ncbi:MAG TPA: hypothetical protein VFW78_09480 [Bacteroidia bacterium]|nr:hypothetical protein [Bacteroidia bacterium]
MMRQFVWLLTTLLILNGFLFNGAAAQVPKSFTHEPAKFLTEMQSFLAVTNKKDAEKLIEKFTIPWNGGKFNGDQQERIYSTCDAMLKKRLKAFPDFSNYLNALIGFTESSQSAASFDNWHAGISKLLTGSVRNFSKYLDVCYDLFATNTLYSSPSTTWKSSSADYRFEFDSLPKIVFKSTSLICIAKNDSASIINTGGEYYPTSKLFFGSGGKVTWERAGLNGGQVYAELKQYKIDVTGSDYTADSVSFYNKTVFNQALTGVLSDRLLANVTEENATYPRFRSYSTDLEIKELVKDASYRGGFSMHGSKIIGSGDNFRPARLTFTRNGKPFLVAASQSFVIRPDRIVADKTSLTIYMDGDSVYHPGVQIKYINGDRELTIIRPSGKSAGTPFYDTYHKVDIYVDQLRWKIDDPLIDMSMISGGGEVKASVESANFFRAQRYQRLQGFSEVNPLYKIKQYAETYQLKVISVPEFASYLKMSESEVRNMFLDLSSQGFLAYDESTDRALVKDRLYYYISSSVGKTDYDILEFSSQISGKPNGTINLLNNDILMRGVSRIALSDTQFVYVIPHEQEVLLKKNRDFTFDGRVHAGRFDYHGKNFSFSYDDFQIKMPAIDSLSMKVPADTVLADGRIPLQPIHSVLADVNGTLSIDRPDNKSSYQKSPEYPIFKSDKESYVYYDYDWIFGGIYKRGNFYFKVDPFTIDSLDNFDPKGLAFDGTLSSAGIFPDIKERISIQEDNSLGFKRVLGEGGLTAYNGKGNYTEKLNLSNNGLRGAGKLKYLNSESRSKDFYFFPDSTNADVDQFNMKRTTIANVEYPAGHGDSVYVNWRPKEDKMFVFKKTTDFTLFNDSTHLDGNLVLAKAGATANGTIAFEAARLESNLYNLKQITFQADTSNFYLNSGDEGVLALSTTNMKSFIDLEKRYGEFNSNGINSYVTLPLNQYICYIQKFRWMMDEKDVQFGMTSYEKKTKDMKIAGSEFVSIHPAQDSLKWYSPNTTYSLRDKLIRAHEVVEVLVADASIIPGDGDLTVEKAANMRELLNARVIANTATRYHTMINSTIKIKGRKNYSGNGDYEYIDQLKIKHLLHLTQIGVDTTFQTFANGDVPDSLNFLLSPNIQYKGRFSIQASRQNPFFTGFARANHNCSSLPVNWFSFAAEINPSGVNVPVVGPVNENGEKLTSAIVFGKDSANVYGTFLSPRLSAADTDILAAEGLLSYDGASKEFRIVPAPAPTDEKEGSKNDEPYDINKGNSIALNDDGCFFRGQGNINLGVDYGQFSTKAIGIVNLVPAEDTLYMDVMLDLDFFFNNDALKAMADLILSYPTLPPTNDNRPVFQEGMRQLLGKDKGEKFLSEIALYGAPKKIPSELEHSIFLTALSMYWQKEMLAYKSVGKIGVGYIGKTPVNRVLSGYVEVDRRRSGDIFNMYLELDGNTWFFFNYQKGVMQSISSDQKYNDIINNMKPDKRVASDKGDKAPYQYLLSTERKKNEFKRRFEDLGE